jgi:hypothetical protein
MKKKITGEKKKTRENSGIFCRNSQAQDNPKQ